TGRHDVAAGLVKRLVGVPALFGAFRDDGPAIEQESVHHLEKLVDGAPLRRPWWFFDVRVQGSGPVDIPTHVVDQAQWLVGGDASAPALLSARAWSTRVPAEAFRRRGSHGSSSPSSTATRSAIDAMPSSCTGSVESPRAPRRAGTSRRCRVGETPPAASRTGLAPTSAWSRAPARAIAAESSSSPAPMPPEP